MYRFFRALITIIWIFDILNFEQFEFLDTTYPINGLAWILIFIFIPCDTSIKVKTEYEENNN